MQELIRANRDKKDVNLNSLKIRTASKYGLQTSPRLVDIIAAVPIDYRKILIPKLLAKPIRTASGVSQVNKLICSHLCTFKLCLYIPHIAYFKDIISFYTFSINESSQMRMRQM